MQRTLTLFALLPLAGCALLVPTPIDAARIAPLVEDVCATHDALLRGELVPLPEGQEREQMLRSSAMLRELVQEATK